MPNVTDFEVLVGEGVGGVEGGMSGSPEAMRSPEVGSQVHWVPAEVGIDCEVKIDGKRVPGLNEFYLMYHPGQGYERHGVEMGVFPGGTVVWRQGDESLGEAQKVYVDDPDFFKAGGLFSDDPQVDQGMDGTMYYECGIVGTGEFIFMVAEPDGPTVPIKLVIS